MTSTGRPGQLAAAFAEARRASGLTQDGVARRIACDRTTVSRIENGHIQLPSARVLQQCESLFGLAEGTLVSLLSVPSAPTATDEPDARTFGSFPYERVATLMSQARSRIWVLQTWVPDLQPFHHGIAAGVEAGADLRILVLGPDSAAMGVRLADLGIDDPRYPVVHGYTLLGEVGRIRGLSDPQAVVRTYATHPPFQLTVIDDVAVMGFFWAPVFSLAGPHVEVSTDSALGAAACEQFEHLWADGAAATFDLA